MTQAEHILWHIQRYGSINPHQAMNYYGCMRLGARIYDLKQMGVPVKSGWITVKNRFGEETRVKIYWLEGYPYKNMKEVH